MFLFFIHVLLWIVMCVTYLFSSSNSIVWLHKRWRHWIILAWVCKRISLHLTSLRIVLNSWFLRFRHVLPRWIVNICIQWCWCRWFLRSNLRWTEWFSTFVNLNEVQFLSDVAVANIWCRNVFTNKCLIVEFSKWISLRSFWFLLIRILKLWFIVNWRMQWRVIVVFIVNLVSLWQVKTLHSVCKSGLCYQS